MQMLEIKGEQLQSMDWRAEQQKKQQSQMNYMKVAISYLSRLPMFRCSSVRRTTSTRCFTRLRRRKKSWKSGSKRTAKI
jgi:hypothetical protein